MRCELVCDRGFGVVDKHLFSAFYMAYPCVEPVNISVTAYACKHEYLCLYAYFLTEQLDCLCAFYKASAECIERLIAHEKNGVFGLPEVVLEVVLDASCFAHSAGGNDYLRDAVKVYCTGFITCGRKFQPVK